MLRRTVLVLVSASVIAIVGLALLVAAVFSISLTEYGPKRFVVAAAVLACGIAVALGVSRALPKFCATRRRTLGVAVVLIALVLAPALSMIVPGRVTYARFGLTVYGLIPVPMLDITISRHGILGFRNKSHFIALDEIQPLLAPDVRVLVIGTGWDGMAQVDPAISNVLGIEVCILRTPQAFELFNHYRSEGRRVVLVAHSTC